MRLRYIMLVLDAQAQEVPLLFPPPFPSCFSITIQERVFVSTFPFSACTDHMVRLCFCITCCTHAASHSASHGYFWEKLCAQGGPLVSLGAAVTGLHYDACRRV